MGRVVPPLPFLHNRRTWVDIPMSSAVPGVQVLLAAELVRRVLRGGDGAAFGTAVGGGAEVVAAGLTQPGGASPFDSPASLAKYPDFRWRMDQD